MTALPNPYIGPRAFQTGERLYGRDLAAAELLDLLIAKRIVLLHSPSGAGKTSLVQAGLVPRLVDEGFTVLPPIRVNGVPAGLGQDALLPPNRYLYSALSSMEGARPPGVRVDPVQLAGLSLDTYVQDVAPGERVILIFDQFEELLTTDPTNRASQEEFVAGVSEALRNRQRWALFVMREDYLAGLTPYLRPIPTRLATRMRLELLDERGAVEAIKGPAHAMNVDFADAAAMDLIADLRQVQLPRSDGTLGVQEGLYVEPVQLQVVCLRLWQLKAPGVGSQIVADDITGFGDVDTALAGYYADSVARISTETATSERTTREWFDRQLIARQDGRGIRSQVRGGMALTTIRACEDAHLIRGDERGGVVWYELAHDRLIEPVLTDNAEWFEINIDVLPRRARLWNDNGRQPGFLLDGVALQEAQEWARANEDEVTGLEQDFLRDAVMAQVERERARKQNRRIRQLAGGLAVVAVVAVLATVFALIQQDQAATARREAERQAGVVAGQLSRLLAAQSSEQMDKEFDLALLLGVEAFYVVREADAADSFWARSVLQVGQLSHPRLGSFLHGHTGVVTSVAFSPDGTLLASGSRDGSIVFSDRASGKPLGSPLQAQTGVTGVTFSPNGEILAAGGDDGRILLWDVASRQPLDAPLMRHTDRVRSVAFSLDGTLLASSSDDGWVIVWDVAKRRRLDFPLTRPASLVNSVAFSPVEGLLASGSDDGTILFWDVARRQQLEVGPTGHTDSVNSVAFSPDGQRLASCSDDGTILLWDVASRQQLEVGPSGPDSVTSVAFSPDGQRLASGNDEGVITLWSVPSMKPLAPLLTGHTASVNSVAFSPVGNQLASGGTDGTAILWDVSRRPPLGDPLSGHIASVNSIASSPDGTLLASGGAEGTVTLWDVASRLPLGDPLTGHTDWVNSVAFSPDGALLASGSDDGTIILWDLASRLPLGDPLTGHAGSVYSVAFSPDATRLASGGANGTVILWDLASLPPLGDRLTGHAGSVYSVAFSPNGALLASGSDDGTVILWDVASGLPQGDPFTGPTRGVSSVAFSPDGRHLAAGTHDGTIILWDTAIRRREGTTLTNGQSIPVLSIAFSPDGTLLVSGTDDNLVILWDVASRLPLGDPLTGPTGSVRSVAFSRDGTRLVSGSNQGLPGSTDSTVIFWDVDAESWLARSCVRANRNFTRDEWQRYFPGAGYHLTCPELPPGEGVTEATPGATETATVSGT